MTNGSSLTLLVIDAEPARREWLVGQLQLGGLLGPDMAWSDGGLNLIPLPGQCTTPTVLLINGWTPHIGTPWMWPGGAVQQAAYPGARSIVLCADDATVVTALEASIDSALTLGQGSALPPLLPALLRRQLRRACEHHAQWLEIWRMRRAIDVAEVGYWDRTLHTARRYTSPRCAEILGFKPEELDRPGTYWRDLVHPDDLPQVDEQLTRHLREQTPFYEATYRMRHRDGHWVWTHSRGVVTDRDADGVALRIAGTHQNVSSAKKAQTELEQLKIELERQSDALTKTLDNMTQGISYVDRDDRLRFFNRRYQELLDLPTGLLNNHPPANAINAYQKERGDFGPDFQLISNDDRAAFESGWGSLSGPTQLPEHYVRRRKDGVMLEIRTRYLPEGGRVRTFTDVTAYFKAIALNRENEERFRSLANLTSDWYWEQDAQFRCTAVGRQLLELSGHDASDFIGKTRWEASPDGLTAPEWVAHRAMLERHESFKNLELQFRTSRGVVLWMSISGVPVFDAKGNFTGYRGSGTDITQRKHSEQLVVNLAFFDSLTGLPNRRLLVDRLKQVLSSLARWHQQAGLIFLDLDNFKVLNDTQGHDKGDAFLRLVAARLTDSVREMDTVARLGGDEFVVLLHSLDTDPATAAVKAQRIAEKLIETLNRPYSLGDVEHYSSASAGVTLFGGESSGVDNILKRADLAMYQAKAAGKNTVRFYDPAMQLALDVRSGIERDLRGCIDRSELVLLYQPVVNWLKQVVGAEALLRWDHPQRGRVAPGEFIEVAEQTGLIVGIGRWVIEAACLQVVQWSSSPETADWVVSVNVSAAQFRDAAFIDQVAEILLATGVDPSRLKIELTESVLFSDTEETIHRMNQLTHMGLAFALDDFGTGYSSLAYLKRLPLDQLKIDQSFVRDILVDPNDAAIAATIIALAEKLDLEVVAEGVETEEQMQLLVQQGCFRFQGYLFGKPALPDVLQADALATHRPSVIKPGPAT